jgi:hypothetical protein
VERWIVCGHAQAKRLETGSRCLFQQSRQKRRANASASAIAQYSDADLGYGLVNESITRVVCGEKTKPGSAKGLSVFVFSDHSYVASSSSSRDIAQEVIVHKHLCRGRLPIPGTPISSLVKHAM